MNISLGIELVRLEDEALFVDTAAGVIASWGVQSPEIGPIGMSILYPPEQYLNVNSTTTSNQVIVSLSPEQTVVYHVYCDWLNGRRFNRCPSPNDWFERASHLAAEIHHTHP